VFDKRKAFNFVRLSRSCEWEDVDLCVHILCDCFSDNNYNYYTVVLCS